VLVAEMQRDDGVRLPGARREALRRQAEADGLEVAGRGVAVEQRGELRVDGPRGNRELAATSADNDGAAVREDPAVAVEAECNQHIGAADVELVGQASHRAVGSNLDHHMADGLLGGDRGTHGHGRDLLQSRPGAGASVSSLRMASTSG
jgi:hypothetical protein